VANLHRILWQNLRQNYTSQFTPHLTELFVSDIQYLDVEMLHQNG